MKVTVIDSHTFNDYELLKETLSHVYIAEIISGGDLGADRLAEAMQNKTIYLLPSCPI